MSKDRVLSLSMRPKCIQDLVGQTEISSSLIAQFKSGRIPHFFIIAGPVGAGKTTLARIISLSLQIDKTKLENLTEDDWNTYNKYEIKEINAANKNGIDDIREIIQGMKYLPMFPSKSKIVILDEAHQLSNAAQNALNTETEDVADHVYYIFCTSAINKIIPSLKRRAFIITPTSLNSKTIRDLVNKASNTVDFNDNTDDLINVLIENDITSPGLVLQASERFFSGMSALDCITYESDKYDSMAICRAVSSGNWKLCSALCNGVGKADVYILRACITGYLKSILLKSDGEKALKYAKAIKSISDSALDDSVCLPSFLACTFIACQHLSN